jgi:metallo-beta-lactamase family protein
MKITLVGAAGGEVTGSCYIVETKQARILIDCGQFQGSKKSEALNRPPTVGNRTLDAVPLTHGHLDHTGRLPLLARMGYTGPVYGRPATLDMTGLILRDSARLQVADTERKNRKHLRAGEPPQEPLYTPDDAEKILTHLRPVPYQREFEIATGIKAIWNDSGHMLGSASIQLIVEEDGKTKRVVFSGDLGPRSAPILREFEPLVPTFAVGRAQLITLLLGKMFRAGKVKPFPIFLDSPMAVEATKIYAKHMELFDDEMKAFIRDRPLSADLKTMQTTPTADESRAINDVRGACLVMAGAGMCNGGRILHHLRANLWKPSTHVLIVGYQSQGSLGRRLVDGEKESKNFRRKNRGESDDSHTRRVQRARGADRFNALVRCDRTEQAARGINPRRRRPARGACQTHSTASPVTIETAEDG